MRILLDTHTLLWWLSDNRHLGQAARQRIADPGNAILVSTVSLWEIVVKVRIGKLRADVAEIVEAVKRQGMVLLDITPKHLATLAALPSPTEHRGPFDHLLVAQAITEGAIFVSADRNCRHYPVAVMTCSDGTSAP